MKVLGNFKSIYFHIKKHLKLKYRTLYNFYILLNSYFRSLHIQMNNFVFIYHLYHYLYKGIRITCKYLASIQKSNFCFVNILDMATGDQRMIGGIQRTRLNRLPWLVEVVITRFCFKFKKKHSFLLMLILFV